MKTVNIHEAKTQLSKLLEEVQEGEPIVIAKAGKPIATLNAYAPKLKKRTAGLLKGQIWVSDDAWEPDEELHDLMLNGPLCYGMTDEEILSDKPSNRVAEEPNI